MLVAAAALLLGGGSLAVVATTALAGGSEPDASAGEQRTAAATTISCPDVGQKLQEVPSGARLQVSKGLVALDHQVHAAYEKMMDGSSGTEVLSRLKQQRESTIETMANAIAKDAAEQPDYLTELVTCTTKPTGEGTGSDGEAATKSTSQSQYFWQRRERNQNGGRQDQDGGRQGQVGGQQGQIQGGPSPDDFVDITSVEPNAGDPPFAAPQGRGASTGTFITECGRNENGHFNSDNVIVTPGVNNGAKHFHDYVGNKATDAFSNDRELAQSGTTCDNGDQSSHYWPVLRKLDGNAVNVPGAGQDGNVGSILRPSSVTLQFRGNQAGQVREMPRFLKIITGDAKAFTNGTANANASWSCVGFENRQLEDKYPICPNGADVVRTFAFQNCWDGRNIDSANHRTHVAFSDQNGRCPNGFTAIPQLVQRITYDVPDGVGFAVDSFPEQLHKPVTDHGDFINVMPRDLMARAVACINSGRNCR
ncbi:DUF1996 domain-containing protein [Streptomyces halobius]|uniref:DUF1996 domain-containing protein n=1 Tax=Streptomyces halobius TaxID=2879846 RepID=A0ABY4MCV7_9ACTN|nr:DUF1996 domain-containing protein [Streptomyces halobius]UQA95227.1 DUF1996 domain-containing protein [Streptomyces halobius]